MILHLFESFSTFEDDILLIMHQVREYFNIGGQEKQKMSYIAAETGYKIL
jgi:hypothetical protein